MDQKKALTLSFTVEQHWLVSIGAPDRKQTHRPLQKQGPQPFDHNHTTMVNWGLARGKPHLILKDILQTEQGLTHIEKIKCQEEVKRKKEEATIVLRQSPRHEEVTKETQGVGQREARIDKSKPSTPKGWQSGASSTPQRSRVLRKLQNVDKEEEDESRDIQEVIGKDRAEDGRFAEVDCGLSVSWNSAKDAADCENFDPVCNKEVEANQQNESPQSVRRKRKEINSKCNGTSSPKRLRESVLCLTEERENGRPASDHTSPEEDDDDCRVPDSSMIKCTVEERADILPRTNSESHDGNRIRSPKRHRISSVNAPKTSSCAPITLSSDEEDSVTVPELTRRLPTSPGAKPQEAAQDIQVIPVIVGNTPVSEAPLAVDNTSMCFSFTQLHCGGYQVKSNGEVSFESGKIVIPVTDMDERREGNLTLERKELMRYSVWDQDDVNQLDCSRSGDDFPVNALLFYVSKKAATTITRELRSVCARHDSVNTGDGASPFILLTLEEPLRGMEGALLRSILELDCLNSMASEKRSSLTDFESMLSPFVSLEDTLELILQTGLDPDLLAVLGVDSSETSSVASTKAEQKVLNAPELRTELLMDIVPVLEKEPLLETSLSGSEKERSSAKRRQDSDATRKQGEVAEQNRAGTLMSKQCDTFELEMDANVELGAEMETVIHAAPELETTSDSDECPALEAGLEQAMSPSFDSPFNSFVAPEIKPETEETEQTLEPPSEKDEEKPVYTLCHRRVKDSYSVSMCKLDTSWTKYRHRGLTRRLIQFPPPPIKGGITVTMEDLQCLDSGQYLNDVIIDFYLKYLLQMSAPGMVERSHVFSSFFYKQLTRRDNASEGSTSESCQRQRRHQRVKTWTRHVDIFKKDFVFVPVNQEAHWYLVIICFPGLEEVTYETHPRSSEWPTESDHNGTTEDPDEAQKSKSLNCKGSLDGSSEPGSASDAKLNLPAPVVCTEGTCQRKMVCKRPCILIMDSLKLSLHERVFKLIREYLQSEWEARRGTSRDFSPDQMKSSHSQVPLQDNSSDCGLYLLQYVESFLKDPVVHFELPLQLQRWFPRHQVRRKRDEIRDLVLKLYRDQNLDSRR